MIGRVLCFVPDGDDEFAFVTCGSAIKLGVSSMPGFRLHSHEIPYGSGSGQQSVTGMNAVDDTNSLWLVKEAYGQPPCVRGSTFKHADTIRLQHVNTKKWLHSHLHASPLSGAQEVSCYGSAGQSDTGDNWFIETQDGDVWGRNDKVRLRHKDTGRYLMTHRKFYQAPIPGQSEVACVDQPSAQTLWYSAEGVYFKPDSADAS